MARNMPSGSLMAGNFSSKSRTEMRFSRTSEYFSFAYSFRLSLSAWSLAVSARVRIFCYTSVSFFVFLQKAAVLSISLE